MRLLRLFAAIHFVLRVVYATDFSVNWPDYRAGVCQAARSVSAAAATMSASAKAAAHMTAAKAASDMTAPKPAVAEPTIAVTAPNPP